MEFDRDKMSITEPLDLRLLAEQVLSLFLTPLLFPAVYLLWFLITDTTSRTAVRPAKCAAFSRLATEMARCVAGDAFGRPWTAPVAVSAWILSNACDRITGCSRSQTRSEGQVHLPPPSPSSSAKGPWLLPCRTTHARQFPKKHSFSYSYLQLAFQVGFRASCGRLLSVDPDGEDRPWTWFSISHEDYLFRGKHPEGFRGKLREYLESEKLSLDAFPNVFLVTAPRFLGYSFNPVSFWYLHDESMTLRYMILEVNNTFDERRMYLLSKDSTPAHTGKEEAEGETPTDNAFRQTWPKDFHVSPFSSRKGTYSLVARETCWTGADGPAIDNTITLRSSKQHAKLVARLFSTEPGKHVQCMSLQDKAVFIASWCWVGFVTFPRILKEAAKLFFGRKLHVWFRPEVLRQSIGRTETARETAVARVFEPFLRARSEQCSILIRYTHTLSGDGEARHEGDGKTDPAASGPAGKVLLHVNSPLFFAQYARDPSFMSKAVSLPPQERTFSVEGLGSSEMLELLFAKQGSSKSATAGKRRRTLRFLRRVARGTAGGADHPMDEWVRTQLELSADGPTPRVGRRELAAYRRAVVTLLLSDWFTFGSPELLDVVEWIFQSAMGWLAVGFALESVTSEISFRSTLALIWVLFVVFKRFT